MKKLLFALSIVVGVLFASPALAVCVSVTKISDTEMCLARGQRDPDGNLISRCIAFADLKTGNKNNWAGQLTGIFQTVMEKRDRLGGMVEDEEARFNPPHREDFYLGDVDGIHHHDPALDLYLVSRCDVIEVTWDRDRFNVTVRTARRTHTPEGELR